MPLDTPTSDIDILAPVEGRAAEVLTAPALDFLAELHRRFDARRKQLLELRRTRQVRFDAGELPGLLAETREIRESDWGVGPIPRDLLDRRVEIKIGRA